FSGASSFYGPLGGETTKDIMGWRVGKYMYLEAAISSLVGLYLVCAGKNIRQRYGDFLLSVYVKVTMPVGDCRNVAPHTTNPEKLLGAPARNDNKLIH